MNHCCGYMESQVDMKCETHGDYCPERIITYHEATKTYRFNLSDGSFVQAKVCPWCGTQLQEWGDFYEEIELNTGNVEFARELMRQVTDKAERIVSEIYRIKTGRGYPSSYEATNVKIIGDEVHVYMRYPRPHDIDDEWVDKFPKHWLYTEGWEKEVKR